MSANLCPVCHQPMESHFQSGFGFGPDRTEEHCVRRGCQLYMVTLTQGDHAKLSPEQIEAYGMMNVKQELRYEDR